MRAEGLPPRQQVRMRSDRQAKVRATARNYLLSAITRPSARPHLRRRGASLLGSESGSKTQPLKTGTWVTWRAEPLPKDASIRKPDAFIFVHLRLLRPPSFSSEDG